MHTNGKDRPSHNRGQDYCRSCSSRDLFLGLDIGYSPIANQLAISKFHRLETFPLCLRICATCGLGQVGEFESREKIFSDYPYLSSTSASWVDQNRRFARNISSLLQLSESDLVVELASNDGYLLREFQKLGTQVLGVEPATNVAKIASEAGIETISRFFGVELGKELRAKYGPPRLVIAKNVVAHVPDINDFILGVSSLVDENSTIIIETPTMLQILHDLQFDTIYHEHFSYLSATALGPLLERHGLRLAGAERVSTHGGSIRFFATLASSSVIPTIKAKKLLQELLQQEAESNFLNPTTWIGLRERVSKVASNYLEWFEDLPENSMIFGYGAPAKAVTFLSLVEPPKGSIKFIVDNSPEKSGKFFPFDNIPIVSHEDAKRLVSRELSVGIILPWNISDELTPLATFGGNVSSIYRVMPEIECLWN